jgi:D-alanyl-D-alanine carboxypeptidase/D-alanyl-D-alanine-endopeptidase (penicillin-binding protein 4)
MLRIYVCGAVVWVLSAAAVVRPAFAESKRTGCDGAVVVKSGRSGPRAKLARTIAGLLEGPEVSRDHWGIAVTAMDGAPIYLLNEGQLFQPASNAKLYTTAAAMALLGKDRTFETKVVAGGRISSPGWVNGNLILVGDGDSNLSGRELPYVPPGDKAKTELAPQSPLRYLEDLADQTVKNGLKRVDGDVVGDDTLFPYEPYAQDWTIDDAVWGFGAPVSALSVNDNQIKVTVTPGMAGQSANVVLDPSMPYYILNATVMTGVAKSESSIEIERAPGSRTVRIYGTISAGAPEDVEEIAIDDPAEYAAIALKQMLEARGVTVQGRARAVHRQPNETRGFINVVKTPLAELKVTARYEGRFDAWMKAAQAGCEPCSPFDVQPMGTHVSARLMEDVVLTNKVSQNLHAELLLRQLGAAVGEDGSTVQGARVVRQFLLDAGIDKDDFVFFDGSGLSGHDLVTPRATARLLQYASTQPWFADWKKSLPVGGEDGSLAERFGKAPLKDHVFAKTGTLGEARALSGYLEGASGKTVIFSIMVGNHMPQTTKDRETMDKIVAAIAAAN